MRLPIRAIALAAAALPTSMTLAAEAPSSPPCHKRLHHRGDGAGEHHNPRHLPLRPSRSVSLSMVARAPSSAALAMQLRGGMIDASVAKASLSAVGELGALCGLGYVAAWKGLLDPSTIASMSRVVFNIFLPCLLFTSVATTVSRQPVLSLLPLPSFAIVQELVLLCIAQRVILPMLGKNPASEDARETAINIAFGNAGNLPIVLCSSLFRHDSALAARAISYVSCYLLGWSPLFWSLGLSVLIPSAVKGATGGSGEAAATAARGPMSLVRGIIDSKGFKSLNSPPVLACLSGVAVGSLPWTPQYLLDPSAPFHTWYQAMRTLAQAYSPVATLVLAGTLYHGQATSPTLVPGKFPASGSAVTKDVVDGGSARESISFPWKVVLVCTGRFLLSPIMTAIMLRVAQNVGFLNTAGIDPAIPFVLYLQAVMPSPQNTVIALQMTGAAKRAGRLTQLLFAVYCASVIPIMLGISHGLHMTGVSIGARG